MSGFAVGIMKKEIERNTEICLRMMTWRTISLFAAVPFLVQTVLALADSDIGYVKWPFWLALVPIFPLVYYMFNLVLKVHGWTTAFFHVTLTIILTPFFLVGPLLIPLLVKGDASRLLYIKTR